MIHCSPFRICRSSRSRLCFRLPRWGWAGLLALALGARADGPADNALASRVLNQTLQHGDVDGGLRATYQLVESELLARLGAPCLLAHEWRVDAGGAPYSVWRFSGLTTYVVPDGRDYLRWKPLSSPAVRFTQSRIGGEFPMEWSGPSVIRRAGADVYEIKLRSGLVWRYEHGALTQVRFDETHALAVACRGTWITSLTEPGGTTPALEVRYDEDLRPVWIAVNGAISSRLEWNLDGSLHSWTNSSGRTFTLAYADGRLSAMQVDDSAPAPIAWRENPGWERGDTRWPTRYQLAQFGSELFRTSLRHRGFVVQIGRIGQRRVDEVCYNPFTGLIDVAAASGRYVYQLPR